MDYSGFLTGNFHWKSLLQPEKSMPPCEFSAVEETTVQREESIAPLLPAPAPAPAQPQPFPAAGTNPRCLLAASPGQQQREGVGCAWEVPAQPLWWRTWHCHTGQAEGLLGGNHFQESHWCQDPAWLLGPCTAATSVTVAGWLQQSWVHGLSVGNSRMGHTKASCSAGPSLPSSQLAEEAQLQKLWKSFN